MGGAKAGERASALAVETIAGIFNETRQRDSQALLSAVERANNSVLELARKDRKSTRLNSSHLVISYAVFCLKKKQKPPTPHASPRRCRSRQPGSPRRTAARSTAVATLPPLTPRCPIRRSASRRPYARASPDIS